MSQLYIPYDTQARLESLLNQAIETHENAVKKIDAEKKMSAECFHAAMERKRFIKGHISAFRKMLVLIKNPNEFTNIH